MSWLKKLLPPKIKRDAPSGRKAIPEGLWSKCPACEAGRLSLRGVRYGAFVACSNYPECKFTRKFAQGGGSDDGGESPGVGERIAGRAGIA